MDAFHIEILDAILIASMMLLLLTLLLGLSFIRRRQRVHSIQRVQAFIRIIVQEAERNRLAQGLHDSLDAEIFRLRFTVSQLLGRQPAHHHEWLEADRVLSDLSATLREIPPRP